MSAAPIRSQEKSVAGAIVVFRDITKEKKLEEEMAKSSRIESIGQLAGGIAHDFNNLLTAMLGNVSLAKMMTDCDSKVHQLLSQTEKASARARDLTQQLLTFARGGNPVKSLSSLGELLKESVDFSLSGSKVRCELTVAEDLWPAEVDQGQFGQVIQNLILNAVQAMPEGDCCASMLKTVAWTAGPWSRRLHRETMCRLPFGTRDRAFPARISIRYLIPISPPRS